MTFCPSRNAMAMAYSATTVLPADVCAATMTDSPRSRTAREVSWNASSAKGYAFASAPAVRTGARIAASSPRHPGGSATSCTHVVLGTGAAPASSRESAAAVGARPDEGDGAAEGDPRLRFRAASRTAQETSLGAL